MPDLPGRPTYEAQAASRLGAVLERQRQQLASMGLDRAAELPKSDWDRYSDELIAIYLLILGGPWHQSYGGLAGRHGVYVSGREVERVFGQWAQTYAKAEAERIVDNTQKIIAKAKVDAAEIERGGPDVVGTIARQARLATVRELFPISDTRRAVLYSVSAVTDATSAGEFAVADFFERMGRDGGDVRVVNRHLVAYWVTSRVGRDRTCSICRPLDGQPEAVWIGRFPSGPTAHEMCRCYLEWRVL